MNKLIKETSFELSDGEFKTIVDLCYQHMGIALRDNKKNLVYSRLANRLRSKQLSSFSQYIEILRANDTEEWNYFVNAITTNLTSFFREPYHFDLLAEHVTNHLLRKAQREPLRMWSSACSSGEEAYSMAMTLIEVFGSMTPPVKILATDLNTEVLAKAKQGIYSDMHLQRLSPTRKSKFLFAMKNQPAMK